MLAIGYVLTDLRWGGGGGGGKVSVRFNQKLDCKKL